ncbi:hypothetical protein Tco_0689899 [Tanacetum coccineum]
MGTWLRFGDYACACLDGSMAWISKDLKTQFTFTFDKILLYEMSQEDVDFVVANGMISMFISPCLNYHDLDYLKYHIFIYVYSYHVLPYDHAFGDRGSGAAATPPPISDFSNVAFRLEGGHMWIFLRLLIGPSTIVVVRDLFYNQLVRRRQVQTRYASASYEPRLNQQPNLVKNYPYKKRDMQSSDPLLMSHTNV